MSKLHSTKNVLAEAQSPAYATNLRALQDSLVAQRSGRGESTHLRSRSTLDSEGNVRTRRGLVSIPAPTATSKVADAERTAQREGALAADGQAHALAAHTFDGRLTLFADMLSGRAGNKRAESWAFRRAQRTAHSATYRPRNSVQESANEREYQHGDLRDVADDVTGALCELILTQRPLDAGLWQVGQYELVGDTASAHAESYASLHSTLRDVIGGGRRSWWRRVYKLTQRFGAQRVNAKITKWTRVTLGRETAYECEDGHFAHLPRSGKVYREGEEYLSFRQVHADALADAEGAGILVWTRTLRPCKPVSDVNAEDRNAVLCSRFRGALGFAKAWARAFALHFAGRHEYGFREGEGYADESTADVAHAAQVSLDRGRLTEELTRWLSQRTRVKPYSKTHLILTLCLESPFLSSAEVAAAVGSSVDTVNVVRHRYLRKAAEGIAEQTKIKVA